MENLADLFGVKIITGPKLQNTIWKEQSSIITKTKGVNNMVYPSNQTFNANQTLSSKSNFLHSRDKYA